MLTAAYDVRDANGRKGWDAVQTALNAALSIRFRLETAADDPMAVRMQTFATQSLRCASIRFSPHSTSLIPGGGQHTGDAKFLLSLQVSGHGLVRQGGREAVVRPGEFFVIDTSAPFHIQTEAVETRSVYLAAAPLRAVLPEIDQCTAMAVSWSEGAGRVLGGVVGELLALAPELDDCSVERFVHAIPHVLGIAMETRLRRAGPVSSDLEVFHRERIRGFVRQNLRDPTLDCATIAAAVKLSPRYVHDLFSTEPETLMRWVWSKRLERIRREIASPALCRRPVGVIAYDWGFSDPAHFSRAFKAAFGITPRACRRAALDRGIS